MIFAANSDGLHEHIFIQITNYFLRFEIKLLHYHCILCSVIFNYLHYKFKLQKFCYHKRTSNERNFHCWTTNSVGAYSGKITFSFALHYPWVTSYLFFPHLILVLWCSAKLNLKPARPSFLNGVPAALGRVGRKFQSILIAPVTIHALMPLGIHTQVSHFVKSDKLGIFTDS